MHHELNMDKVQGLCAVFIFLLLVSGLLLCSFTNNNCASSAIHLKTHDSSEPLIRRFPQAIVIGCKKCGTGTLRRFMQLNPKIVPCQGHFYGEVHFFDKDQLFMRGYGWYLSQMPETRADQITVDVTPRYFVTPEVPQRIYQLNSAMKLILIVRDPVQRVISDYTQHTKYWMNMIYPSFHKIVFNQSYEVNTSYDPIRTSLYYTHLLRWYSIFPRSQMLILDGEKFKTDPATELNRLEAFLGVESVITREKFVFDKEKGFYCMVVNNKTSCMGKDKGLHHSRVSDADIRKLKDFFSEYNKNFSIISGRSFSWINTN